MTLIRFSQLLPAYRRFVKSALGREMADNCSATEWQLAYTTVCLMEDRHCYRISRLSIDWCYGWRVW